MFVPRKELDKLVKFRMGGVSRAGHWWDPMWDNLADWDYRNGKWFDPLGNLRATAKQEDSAIYDLAGRLVAPHADQRGNWADDDSIASARPGASSLPSKGGSSDNDGTVTMSGGGGGSDGAGWSTYTDERIQVSQLHVHGANPTLAGAALISAAHRNRWLQHGPARNPNRDIRTTPKGGRSPGSMPSGKPNDGSTQ